MLLLLCCCLSLCLVSCVLFRVCCFVLSGVRWLLIVVWCLAFWCLLSEGNVLLIVGCCSIVVVWCVLFGVFVVY